MRIPAPYRTEDQDYIVVATLKTLCKRYGLSTEGNRIDLIERIEEYSGVNAQNEEQVLNDIDDALKIGMKTCVLRKISHLEIDNVELINNSIIRNFGNRDNQYLCNYVPTRDITLVNYEVRVNEDGHVDSIEFTFCVELLRARSSYTVSGVQVFYPIHITVDNINNFVIGRAKTTSSLFRKEAGLNINSGLSTSTEKLIKEAMDIVLKKLNIQREDATMQRRALKRTIFNILDEYTKTPPIIQNKIDMLTNECNEFARDIFVKLSILTQGEVYKDAKYDLSIFIEKYASITYSDKSIFKTDRMAYPIRFFAQDNEFTKIQETSAGFDDPLQGKKAFFDSKKSVYTDKKCDKICLCHKAYIDEESKFYSKNDFNVIIYLSGNDCACKFNRFVREGDIQNVLSRIIQLYDVQR